MTLTMWLLLAAPAFFFVSSCLYVSQLCQSEWGETKAGPLYVAPKGWGSWSFTLLFLSRGWELFPAGRGAEQCQLGGWDDSSFSS